jgi:hypothetical protein
VDHQLEAFCQKGHNMKLGVASMVPAGTLPTTSNRSELSQAWTAGNIVWDPEASLAAPRSHGKRWDVEEVELRGSQIELLAGLGRFG